MFTIKSVSSEGTYYLVNGWSKYNTFWEEERRLTPNKLFKTASTAKMSLNKLLKIMDDYLQDKFTLVEIDENGNIKEKSKLDISIRRLGNSVWDRYKVNIKEI